MAQRGFILKLGAILKRWEHNKRQVIKNQDGLLPGNKKETEDFDVFDQWFGRQRKMMRDYLGVEDHEELRPFRRFFKQETDIPQIHLHFGIWSSLSQSDNTITLERLTRLINEYHVARVDFPPPEDGAPLESYQHALVREQDILRQAERAKENYHDTIAVLRNCKARQDEVYWNMEGDYYNQRKVLHQARIAKKSYEDVLRFEAAKSRAALMKITHELERLVRSEEEKRLTQLLAIIDEYFRLLLCTSELDGVRRESLRCQAKHVRALKLKIPQMTKTWMKDHREALVFPQFEEAGQDISKSLPGVTDVLRVIKDELHDLHTRLCVEPPAGDVICLSTSNDSLDESIQKPQEKSREMLFKSSADFNAKKSLEASDLSVEDLEEKDSTNVLYPTVTSSARAFTLANQRRRYSHKGNQSTKSVSSSCPGHCDTMPGALICEERIAGAPVRGYTRQITLSSSEDELCEARDQSSTATRPSHKDAVVPFSPSTKDLRLYNLTGIYVMAKTTYTSANPRELSFSAGDIIKQERLCGNNGMAYGYRKTRTAPKVSGFYSLDNVKFHRFGIRVQKD